MAGIPAVVKIVGDPVWERARRLGLTDAEEDAIVAFMQTLSDGFTAPG